MKRALLLLAFSAAAFAQDGFQPLFNGKNLDGWDGDPRMWSVRDGMIVGHTEGVTMTDNSFLISKQPYRNFILRAEMKLRYGCLLMRNELSVMVTPSVWPTIMPSRTLHMRGSPSQPSRFLPLNSG